MADFRKMAGNMISGIGNAAGKAVGAVAGGIRKGGRGIGAAAARAAGAGKKAAEAARGAVAGAANSASHAASEVAAAAAGDRYVYAPPAQAVLDEQREISRRLGEGESPSEVLGDEVSLPDNAYAPVFSVIITTNEPTLRHFERTLSSVLLQTYGQFEIIVADRSLTAGVRELLQYYPDNRIRYLSLAGCRGEAQVLNTAARNCIGDYLLRAEVGDLLTADALFEIFLYLVRTNAELVYTDEDHIDSSGRKQYIPDRKPGFNKDYLLSTNYVGHLLAVRRELFLALKCRREFEGALDYDLMLRAPKSAVGHIAKILYHSTGVTAAEREPEEGRIREAGRAALQAYFRERRIPAEVSSEDGRRLYTVRYAPDIFTARSDVGIVGGKVLNRRHRIAGGMMDSAGRVMFEGWDEAEGGPFDRALTVQDAIAVDVRCMRVRPELQGLYTGIFGDPEDPGHLSGRSEEDLMADSLRFCRMVREMGYLVVWDPGMISVQ